uniref:Uncharacterized protein n=1 Tax=Pectinophora gossypiella TaxID=13191 RepID=A0A1E1WCS7_PECGO
MTLCYVCTYCSLFQCCAVSFIENLTADSLNMDRKEFDCYMAMPASIGGSSWACALSLCGAAREAEEQRALTQRLLKEADDVRARADKLAADAHVFEEQIAKKVQDVLAKTPLEITPRRELPRFGKFKNTTPLIDLDVKPEESKPPAEEPEDKQLADTEPVPDSPKPELKQDHVIQPVQIQTEEPEEKLTILGFEAIEKPSPPKSPQHEQWDLKQTSSLELLTPSPLGFTPFDSRSIDELMTPDEFGSEHLAPGLSNINYDIDLSDFSGDNSIAEDAPKEPKDPFSPEGIKKDFDPFAPHSSRGNFSTVLDSFDEFSLVDPKSNESTDAFEVIHHDPFSPIKPHQAGKDPFTPEKKPASHLPLGSKDPFSPMGVKLSVKGKDPEKQDGFSGIRVNIEPKNKDPFSPKAEAVSILDDNDSPTSACLLPSPLQPQNSKQT